MHRDATLVSIFSKRKIYITDDKLPGRIRELRESKGLSRQEFAKKVGVNKCSMWEWESGHKTPSESSLKKICETFDIDMAYFLYA